MCILQFLFDSCASYRVQVAKTIFVVGRAATNKKSNPASELHLFQKGEIFDNETQEFEQKLLQKFNIDQSTTHVLKKETTKTCVYC